LLTLVTEKQEDISLILRVMNIKWKKLVFRLSVWLALEAYFGYVGVDTIADYSEYLLDRHNVTASC